MAFTFTQGSVIVLLACAFVVNVDCKPAHPVEFSESVGGQHIDLHIDGFVVDAIYVRGKSADGRKQHVHKRKMQFDDHPHLKKLELHNQKRKLMGLPLFSATMNSRDRAVSCAKLNMLANGGAISSAGGTKFDETRPFFEPYVQMGAGLSGNNTWVGEMQYLQDIWNMVAFEVATTAGGNATQVSYFDTLIGVDAIQFKRGGITTMAYVGVYRSGDYANSFMALFDWIIGKGGTYNKDVMWEKDAGQQWTPSMQTIYDMNDPSPEIFMAQAYRSSFITSLLWAGVSLEASSRGFDVSFEESYTYYYWSFEKVIADRLITEAEADGNELLFSGHSGGGMRAALMSMYTDKMKSKTVDAITFGAPGVQCWPRHMVNGANLLQWVDPTKFHSQMTEYVHPLDILGNTDASVYRKCLIGKSQIKPTSTFYTPCQALASRHQVFLLNALIQSGLNPSALTSNQIGILADYQACYMSTHTMETILLNMMNETQSDGTTDSGCYDEEVATLADPEKFCPGSGTPCDASMPWGHPGFGHCTVDKTYQQLSIEAKQDPTMVIAGGLGAKNPDPSKQLTWVCIKNHSCAWMRNGYLSVPLQPLYFCFVYDQNDKTFTAWGDNTCLNLVTSTCLAP